MTTDIAVTSPNPVYLNPAAQAVALGEALDRAGFATQVLMSRDYMQHPCVVVKCAARHVAQTEYIFAAPEVNGDDRWWFWRTSPKDPLVTERIAPISHVSATCDLLVRTIAFSSPDGGNDV